MDAADELRLKMTPEILHDALSRACIEGFVGGLGELTDIDPTDHSGQLSLTLIDGKFDIEKAANLIAEMCTARWLDALKKIAEGDWPRPHVTIYRDDGKQSKHDLCSHGRRIYEDCDECVSAFAQSVLNPIN